MKEFRNIFSDTTTVTVLKVCKDCKKEFSFVVDNSDYINLRNTGLGVPVFKGVDDFVINGLKAGKKFSCCKNKK